MILPVSFVGHTVGEILEIIEGSLPVLVEPISHRADPARIESVDALRPDGLVGHKASLLELLEMLRDRRARDRQASGELADPPGAVGKLLDDLAPGRITKRIETASTIIVRHGLPLATTYR